MVPRSFLHLHKDISCWVFLSHCGNMGGLVFQPCKLPCCLVQSCSFMSSVYSRAWHFVGIQLFRKYILMIGYTDSISSTTVFTAKDIVLFWGFVKLKTKELPVRVSFFPSEYFWFQLISPFLWAGFALQVAPCVMSSRNSYPWPCPPADSQHWKFNP
jgi:hypothetical protein